VRVASPSSTKTLARHPWIDPRNQFEQLIERPVSVQPLPDNVHSIVLLTSKGVMVTTSDLLLPSTAVGETVIKAFPEVVILLVKFISPAPVSASTPLVPGIPQLALAISSLSWMHIDIAVFQADAADTAAISLVRWVYQRIVGLRWLRGRQ
jgi:hypothetical protein